MNRSWIGALMLLLAWPAAASAQSLAPGGLATTSFSGQFIIQAPAPSSFRPRSYALETNHNFVRLDATSLPVACERIKQIITRELALPANWRGKIFVSLHRAISEEENVTLRAERFRNGWQYQVDIPDVVQKDRFVRAMTQVLLLELANREAVERSAELPAWLTEGFTRRLLTLHESEVILAAPGRTPSGIPLAATSINARRLHPLEAVHKELTARGPLTFDELSWPAPDDLAGEKLQFYGNSAHLFVNELLRLQNGPAALARMLQALPRFYNWQFAFLEAYSPWFQSPLDVEKWWMLQVMRFTGRDLSQTWTVQESCSKLQQAFRISVQVRSGPNEMPILSEVDFQTLVRQWQQPGQVEAIQEKIRDLDLLRLRLAPELLPLVNEFQQVLEVYLKESRDAGFLFWRNGARKRVAENAARQLDALEVRCRQVQAAQLAESRPGAGPTR